MSLTFKPKLKALIDFKDGELRTLTRTTRSRLIEAVNRVRDLPKVRRSSRALYASTGNHR